VILHIDHIQPSSKGGSDDIMNLITSCEGCNLGKGARELSDDAVIVKKKDQLDRLQEQREILEMMMDWQNELINLEEEAVKKIAEFWGRNFPGYSLNESGLAFLRNLIRKYDAVELIEAIKISAAQYTKCDIDENGNTQITKESVSMAFNKLGGILSNRNKYKDNPELKEIHKMLNTIKYEYGYVNIKYFFSLIDRATKLGVGMEELNSIAGDNNNWTGFKDDLEYRIAEIENERR
jgi:hypothetical protein